MKGIFTICASLCLIMSAFAQSSVVRGKVVTSDGVPIPYANVWLDQTSKGGITNQDGVFEIKNIDKGIYTLMITSVGYQKYQKQIRFSREIVSLPAIVLTETTESLDEVIVNGNGKSDFIVKKPSSSLRLTTETIKLPQNIQIVSDEVLKNQNITNMMESVTRNVSGAMMIEHWGHFARINMRGFNLPAFRNGMNVQMPWGPLSQDMSMVEQIEFVKGPAGFMLSAGEPGGFYNVVTKKPTDQQINELTFTAGSFDNYRVTFDSGGKLTSNGRLKYRFNAMIEDGESHIKYDESSRYSLVPAITYEISDNTTFTNEFTYQNADMIVGSAYVFAPTEPGFEAVDRNFSSIDEGAPVSNIEEYSLTSNFTHKFNDQWNVNAQYMYMRYNAEGASFWPWSVAENGDMIRGVSIWDALSTNQLAQVYLNGEFYTGGIKHKVMGGYDYRDLKYYADWGQGAAIDETPFNIYNPEYGNAVWPDFDRSQSVKVRGEGNLQGTKYNAFYVQDEIWMLDDQLRVTLAGRYTDAEIFAYGDSSNESKFTPRVGLSFDILPTLTIYGLYDQSFTPNYGISRTNQKFDPVEATDIEGGIKKSFLDGRLTTGLTAYKITKNNILATDPEDVNFSVQVGQVTSQGLEFDLQGEITPELNVVLNYANTKVEVTEGNEYYLVGTRLAGHAKHITNGWFNYNFNNDSALKGFGLSLGYQYQIDRSSWAWSAGNEAILPDYFRLDGGLSWNNDHLRVNLNINNILDDYLYSGSAYSSYVYWQSEPGINGRLTLAYKF
ncbi:iron complex outermembrane recepter protein [Zhouia amylolytica]|uniref:Iron complex outermembrane recepter protein n=1 Tax=Zhouia amylolytica TaxID=376730 RepID=A0A1I6VLR2_9FLAO|nr:TonB-dependent receptor [Zhouia amylolytica]SFT14364.1 iron complex outermembrane recepter protein [Zhouia amylolytica]